MRRKKAAALVAAAATAGSLGLAGVQHASAADSQTKTIVILNAFGSETYAVWSQRGGVIKSIETMDRNTAGDKWGVWVVDHQNRAKAGKCGLGSTTAWFKNLGTVGVPSRSPFGPGFNGSQFTQINVQLCEGGPGPRSADVRISYVGDIQYQRVSPPPGTP